MNVTQWKAIAMLSGMFLLGSVAGVGGTLAYVAKERAELRRFDFGRRGDMPVLALMRRLDLTQTQREQVVAILEKRAPERRKAMQAVMDQCGTGLREEKAKLDREIREVLTPKQRTRFDELSARQEERLFAPFEPGRGAGMGPGRGQGRGRH